MYDLGSDGLSLTRAAQMNFNDIVRCTLSALRTGDKSLVESLVTVSVLPKSESSTLHLLAITTAGLSLSLSLIALHVCCTSGLRLYFTTTPNGEEGRPSLLALVHVRLPPGFSPSSAALRPGPTVHQAFYNKGYMELVCLLFVV